MVSSMSNKMAGGRWVGMAQAAASCATWSIRGFASSMISDLVRARIVGENGVVHVEQDGGGQVGGHGSGSRLLRDLVDKGLRELDDLRSRPRPHRRREWCRPCRTRWRGAGGWAWLRQPPPARPGR